uniref:Phytosulfokine n=1 Tax=Ananas comosus var. bracteatus TaxID=296719 RepID=A0A6V7QWQ6_ANACO
MKQSPHSHGAPPLLLLIFTIFFFFFFFLIHTSRASRDLLKQHKETFSLALIYIYICIGTEAAKVVDGLSQTGQQGKAEREDLTTNFDILMGMEECEDEHGNDEERLKRRMISEAHLDYIYTQRQNKP